MTKRSDEPRETTPEDESAYQEPVVEDLEAPEGPAVTAAAKSMPG